MKVFVKGGLRRGENDRTKRNAARESKSLTDFLSRSFDGLGKCPAYMLSLLVSLAKIAHLTLTLPLVLGNSSIMTNWTFR